MLVDYVSCTILPRTFILQKSASGTSLDLYDIQSDTRQRTAKLYSWVQIPNGKGT